MKVDASTVAAGCQIAVGTPGRIVDLMRKNVLPSDSVGTLCGSARAVEGGRGGGLAVLCHTGFAQYVPQKKSAVSQYSTVFSSC